MADYNINLTIQNIWSIFKTLFDIGIMWMIIYYAIKFVKNNNRTIQIFKGIILVLLVDGLAKIFGFTTVEYLMNNVISWGFLAIIIIFQPEIRGVLERLGKTILSLRLILCWQMKERNWLNRFIRQPLRCLNPEPVPSFQ